MNGVINFYKPPGMTSAQAVAFIKRLTKSKVGHAGTLDPEAAGVLPIMLGRATKICDILMDFPKQYLAEIAFGAATDTQDAQGRVIATGAGYPDIEALRNAAAGYVGEVPQLPPQYSALKIGGKSAHRLARSGATVELTPRLVRFDDISVLAQLEENSFLMRINCGKGAYIRTLCHDLGEKLGCPAHLRFLLREASGGLSIQNSRTAEEIQAWHDDGLKTDHGLLLRVDEALRHLPKIELPGSLRFQAINGVALNPDEIPCAETIAPDACVRLYSGGEFIGVYRRDAEQLRVSVMLYEG